MSDADQVFALLVEANPVPDPAAPPERIADVDPRLRVVDPGRTTMQTQSTTKEPAQEPRKRPMRWIAAAIAAVVVLILGAAAVLLLANDDTQPVVDEPPATTTPPVTTVPPAPESAPEADQARIDAAINKVEDFYGAINAGDLDAVIAVLAPDGNFDESPSAEADRNTWDANTVFAASYPFEVQRCESAGILADRVFIECTMDFPDPVWVALGVSDGVVAPWHVFEDGHMEWLAFKGQPFAEPNQAYVDYLQLHDPDAYDEVCSQDAYPLGSVISPQGYTLTRACAELATPLAEDVAAWIEAGRPE